MARDKQHDLDKQSERISHLLRGKTVTKVQRHRIGEILIEFDDGTRLFINTHQDDLDFSIT